MSGSGGKDVLDIKKIYDTENSKLYIKCLLRPENIIYVADI